MISERIAVQFAGISMKTPVMGASGAWGYLTYTRPLTEKQASDYELRPAPDNPDRPRPIAEQMKNAAKLAEADRGPEAPAPQRRQPDRDDR